MTGLAIAVAVWLFLMLPVWAICTMSKRADERDEARRRHPANNNWPMQDGFSPDTEAAIEQAVNIIDDGRALVRETEDYLREVSDA